MTDDDGRFFGWELLFPWTSIPVESMTRLHGKRERGHLAMANWNKGEQKPS